MKGWFQTKTACEYADVSKNTLLSWISKGLETRKIGGLRLTRPEWIDEYIEQQAEKETKRDEVVKHEADDFMKSFQQKSTACRKPCSKGGK